MGKHRKGGCAMYVLAAIVGVPASVWTLSHFVVSHTAS